MTEDLNTAAKQTILGLKLPTDPRWADVAAMSMEEILTDHAYCEQKAATQCISLIQKYPEKLELVEGLAPVVTEEWGHFRMVLAEMKSRGYRLGRQRKDEYVNQLLQQEAKGLSTEDKLLEKLLICALIEARSCERFRILSEHLEEERMRQFYYKFMVSEAGHYRLFLDLARRYFDAARVKAGWEAWLLKEREILLRMPARGDRMH